MHVLELPLRLRTYAIPTPSHSLCQAFYSTIIQTEESALASLKSLTAPHLAFCCCFFSLPAKNPFPSPNCFRKLAEFGPHDCFIKSCSVFPTGISLTKSLCMDYCSKSRTAFTFARWNGLLILLFNISKFQMNILTPNASL